MAILSLDRELDFDFMAGFALDDLRLPVLLLQAQVLIESSLGCNRSLEITTQTELRSVPSSGLVYLSQLPVVGALTQVQARGGNFTQFDRTTSLSDWTEITPDQFEFDTATGELRLKTLQWLQGRFQGTSRRYRGGRSTAAETAPQLRLTYSTGFDFDALNTDTRLIKTVTAAIAFLYVQSSNQLYPPESEAGKTGASNAIQRVRVEDVVKYEIEYASNVQAHLITAASQNAVSAYQSSQLGDLLKLITKYKPRGRSV